MIALAAASVVHTISEPRALGIRCLKMMRLFDAPRECAASTYSFSRSERNWLRTIRARSSQPNRPRMMPTPSGVREPGKLLATTISTTSRSEEHTSELQSRQYLVCRLLLEKKKLNIILIDHRTTL